jgi:aspartate aminotransferase
MKREPRSHAVLADRLKTLAPSSTLAVQAKAQELRRRGVDVISFGAGEPDFDTPERIKDAAIQAMRRGRTKYTEVGGVPELRAAVCGKFKRDNGLDYEPADVLVSCGAKHTLFNMVVALLNPGDEVLVPSPYWVSYPEQARLVGAVPVGVPTQEATGFDLDPDRLRAAVTPRTKAVILNSPNNPTGAVFSPAALAAVARVAVERNLVVVADECYEALTFEGRHVSIAALDPEVKARTLIINTCSKAYAMTGWRIGFAAGPRELIRAMTDVQSQVTSNPASIAQWAPDHRAGPQRAARRVVRHAEGGVLRVRERLEAVRPAVEERRRPARAEGVRRRHRVSPRGSAGGRRARRRLRLRRSRAPVVRDQRSAHPGGPGPHGRGALAPGLRGGRGLTARATFSTKESHR